MAIDFSVMLHYNLIVTFKFEVMEVLMKTKAELLPECPVATTVQLIGNKWKLLIIRNLLVRPWRFNELHKNLDGISQKVLTDSLRSMALSELGESLKPILDAMSAWGESYKSSIG